MGDGAGTKPRVFYIESMRAVSQSDRFTSLCVRLVDRDFTLTLALYPVSSTGQALRERELLTPVRGTY